MPVYVYNTDDGKTHELLMTNEQRKQREFTDAAGDICIQLDDGRIATRDLLGQGVGGTQSGCWPKKSWAIGVHPDQVDEANRYVQSRGYGMHYHQDGDAVFHSNRARREYLKKEGYVDRSAYC